MSNLESTSHEVNTFAPIRTLDPALLCPPSAAGAGGRRPPHPASLERRNNNVTPSTIRAIRNGCRSRMCPCGCGRRYGHTVRDNLKMKAQEGIFKACLMMTLTIDRHGTQTGLGFEEPEEAFDYVTLGRYIPRLMQKLGIIYWFWVLEFQSKSGDGWPHWHIVADVSHYPGNRLPKSQLQKAWKLWRDTWRIGSVDVKLQPKKSPIHAIHYATKYLTKYPDRGFPAWVLQRSNVHFIAASRSVGAVVSKPLTAEQKAKVARAQALKRHSAAPARSRERSAARPSIDRLAECGFSSTIIIKRPSGTSSFAASIPARVQDLWLISRDHPELPGVRTVEQEGGYVTYEFDNRVDPHTLKNSLAKLEAALEAIAYFDRREEIIQRMKRDLLTQWDEHGLRHDPPSDVDGS